MSDQPRIVPTRPGWWWATGNNHAPVEVALIGTVGKPIRDDRILWVVSESSYRGPVADAPPGFFIAPIPGPDTCAALAECGEALADQDVLWDGADPATTISVTNRVRDTAQALVAAIRAERDAEREGERDGGA